MYRIGQARDIHSLIKSRHRPMILGGVALTTGYVIKATSDGDVILHAISNAILGCIQAGDIGLYFDDKDLANNGLDSNKILQFCLKKLDQQNYQLVNIDLTVMCEKIFFRSYRDQIIKSLQRLVKINLINFKATRFEKRSKQIACDVVVLVRKSKNV